MTRVNEASANAIAQWWRTSITDMTPGVIRMRGYAIQDLIGNISFPAMIWLMLRGELPSPGQADLLGAALVAAVDHGPQAPAIAIARMAITCGVGINNAMASAINVLGDIHGGAGQQAMELYSAIEARCEAGADHESAADAEIVERLEARRLVEGFGHRFHELDPRAPRLLELVEAARRQGLVQGRFARIGVAVEKALLRHKGHVLPMNIDGATAVVYSELGFPPELGRGLFILSRSVGALAHTWEQMQQGDRIKGPAPPALGYLYEGPAPRALTKVP
jgi:citrate synthase